MKNQVVDRRVLRDIVPRYYAGHMVVICAMLLVTVISFFLFKMAEPDLTRREFFITFKNNMYVEGCVCLFLPVGLLGFHLKGFFYRKSSDRIMSLPVNKSGYLGAVVLFLTAVFAVFAVLGIALDLILAGYASDGFIIPGYLLRKYLLLGDIYFLSLGIGLVAFAGASSIVEYVKNALLYGVVTYVGIILGTYLSIINYDELRELFLEHVCGGIDGSFYEPFNGFVVSYYAEKEGLVRILPLAWALLIPAAIYMAVGFWAACRRPAERAEGMCKCEWSHVLNQGLTFFLLTMPRLQEEIIAFNCTDRTIQEEGLEHALRALIIRCICVWLVQIVLEGIRRRKATQCYKAWKGIICGILLDALFVVLFRQDIVQFWDMQHRWM